MLNIYSKKICLNEPEDKIKWNGFYIHLLSYEHAENFQKIFSLVISKEIGVSDEQCSGYRVNGWCGLIQTSHIRKIN